jgi:hypothetical protein
MMPRSLKNLAVFVSAALIFLFVLFVAAQTAQVVELADRVHPTLGRMVLWLLLGLYAVLLVAPLAAIARLRKPLARPTADSGPEFDRYLEHLACRLRSNPALQGCGLFLDSASTPGADVTKAMDTLGGKADVVIRETAGLVFASTAISQSGRLDGLAVLAAQVRMVWRIAHLYDQRPSARETIALYREVAQASFLAFGADEVLDTVADRAVPIIQEMVGTSFARAVPGFGVVASVVMSSLLEGSANAFLTLRVGIIAKRYCGALSVIDRASLKRSAAMEAVALLGGIVRDVGGRIVSRLRQKGWDAIRNSAAAACDSVVDAGKQTGQFAAETARKAGAALANGWDLAKEKIGNARRRPNDGERSPADTA